MVTPTSPPATPFVVERKPNGSGAVSIVADDVTPPTELASTPVAMMWEHHCVLLRFYPNPRSLPDLEF